MKNLTRKELCELILRKFGHSELEMPIPVDITKIPESVIYGSTTIGICMEELGLLHNYENAMYIKNRGGNVLISHDENGNTVILSFRELLESMKE